MTTFLVSQGIAIETPSGVPMEVETLDYAWCCDHGCGLRYMKALGIPDTPEARGMHTAGQYFAPLEEDSDDRILYSWGDSPCATSPHHEYCPACGRLTIEGDEEEEDNPPAYGDPDPIMDTIA